MKKIYFKFFLFLILLCTSLNAYTDNLVDLKYYLFEKSLSFSNNSDLYWLYDNLDIVKEGINDYELKNISKSDVSYRVSSITNIDFITDITGNIFQNKNTITAIKNVLLSINIALENGNLINASYYTGLFAGAYFDLALWSKIVEQEYYNDLSLTHKQIFENILFKIDYESEFFNNNISNMITLIRGLPDRNIDELFSYLLTILFYGKEREFDISYSVSDYFNNLPDFNPFLLNSELSLEDLNDEYINNISKLFNISVNYLYKLFNEFPKPDTAPAAEIRNLNVIEKNKEVVLFWDRSPDYSKLVEQLLYINRGKGWEEPLSLSPAETKFTITDLINEKQYFFKITAMRPENNESNGMIISAIPLDISAPKQISDFNALSGNRKVYLSWKPSTDTKITFQNIYISENGQEYTFLDDVLPDVNNYTVDNLQNLVEYSFKITTIDKVPNESKGVVANAIPEDTVPPEPVTDLILHPVSERIIASWTPSINSENDAVRQIIKLFLNDEELLLLEFDNVELSTYEFTKLKNDLEYTVMIYVVDDADNVSDIVKDKAVPTALKEMFVKHTGNDIPFNINQFIVKNHINIPNKSFAYLDFNNDGRTDIVMINEHNNLILLQGIDGLNYTNVSIDKQIDGQIRANSIKTADLNHNGWTDIIIATSGFWEEPVKVYMNRNGNYFEKAEEELNLNIYGENNFITLFDFDNNGLLDIYFSFSIDNRLKGHPNNVLMVQQNDNTFLNQTPENLAIGLNSLFAVAADFNLNGKTDIYVSNENGLNKLFFNVSNNFIDKTADYNLNDKSGIPIVFDYNNDGDYDLFIYDTFNNEHVFYENQLNTHRFIKFDIMDNYEKYIGSRFILKKAGEEEVLKIEHISYSDILYRPRVFSVIFGLKDPDIKYDVEILPVASEKFNYLNLEAGAIIKLF